MKGKIRNLFDSNLSLFLEFYANDDRRAVRFGFDTLIDLWNANPEVRFL